MKKDNLKQQLLKCAENQPSGCSNGDEGSITTVLAFSVFFAVCGSFTAGCTVSFNALLNPNCQFCLCFFSIIIWILMQATVCVSIL